jgi:hypothetical protein
MSLADGFPSGSWGFGPVSITWSLKAANAVDVGVSVLGINIDNLTGTLSPGNCSLKDNLAVLGVVNGSLELDAIYQGTPAEQGIWVRGEFKVLGIDSGVLNHRIVSF